jgi:hypothetical protein
MRRLVGAAGDGQTENRLTTFLRASDCRAVGRTTLHKGAVAWYFAS